jgi:hypothetical protein
VVTVRVSVKWSHHSMPSMLKSSALLRSCWTGTEAVATGRNYSFTMIALRNKGFGTCRINNMESGCRWVSDQWISYVSVFHAKVKYLAQVMDRYWSRCDQERILLHDDCAMKQRFWNVPCKQRLSEYGDDQLIGKAYTLNMETRCRWVNDQWIRWGGSEW